jgi:hypothetical protein
VGVCLRCRGNPVRRLSFGDATELAEMLQFLTDGPDEPRDPRVAPRGPWTQRVGTELPAGVAWPG